MSAGEVLRAALLAHLGGVVRVFDAPPLRASMPQVVLDDPVLAAADAAGVRGRVGTIAVGYADDGESPVRLRALIAVVEAAMDGVPADLGGGGWRLATLRLTRSRLWRGKSDRWVAMSEFAVRMYRIN
ncbi:DUF3168 domain-containing protein [Sphingomonas sp. RP10(2022)]|uniref:DUF3168 domain-containing protein n=1 Tax=Sphingomonas liriopis TaxID=2949094 RepID=A0A9X2KQY3_9SPHN|nr:DUF3168 domain-containing protein [Sphingomonas liriopis]MCP3735041.1 DUF3168 domain-containing protein [Sphingomonas liriopis]